MPFPRNKLLWGQNQIPNGLSCRRAVCLNLNVMQGSCLNLNAVKPSMKANSMFVSWNLVGLCEKNEKDNSKSILLCAVAAHMQANNQMAMEVSKIQMEKACNLSF